MIARTIEKLVPDNPSLYIHDSLTCDQSASGWTALSDVGRGGRGCVHAGQSQMQTTLSEGSVGIRAKQSIVKSTQIVGTIDLIVADNAPGGLAIFINNFPAIDVCQYTITDSAIAILRP